MAGDAKTTLDAADKLASVVTEEGAATIAWVQPIMLAPYWAHAQYSSPDTILALADPGDTFPFVKGMWHYARGIAFAEKQDFAAAAGEVDAIDTMANKADLSFLTSNFVPADQLLQLARHVVLARIAQRRAISTRRSTSSSAPSRSRTGSPTWSRPIGTILCGNHWARHYSTPGERKKRSRSSNRASRSRQTTVG